jgi:hypothetical protein
MGAAAAAMRQRSADREEGAMVDSTVLGVAGLGVVGTLGAGLIGFAGPSWNEQRIHRDATSERRGGRSA